MVSVFATSAVGRGFKPRSTMKISICCYSDKHALLRNKNKIVGSESENVFEWRDMTTRGLLFKLDSIVKIQLCLWSLVQSGHNHSLRVTCARHDIATITYVSLNNNHSLTNPV